MQKNYTGLSIDWPTYEKLIFLADNANTTKTGFARNFILEAYNKLIATKQGGGQVPVSVPLDGIKSGVICIWLKVENRTLKILNIELK